MIINISKLKFLLLLIISVLTISCSSTGSDKSNPDQISNDAFQDAQINFNELKILFKNKKYNEAYSLLDYMKSNLPYSRFTKHGKILEIHSYYEQDKYSKTIETANEFINSHPTHAKLDYVLYLRAIASLNQNQPLFQNLSQIPKIIKVNRSKIRQTFSYFSEIAQKYPKSNYSDDTVKNITELRQVLAKYELNDAYILFDLNKYNEVIKHCDYLIKNYPNTTTIPDALKLQAKAYRSIGQIDTAESIEGNLRRNYAE